MTLDTTKVRSVLTAEREKLVHQLLELGATESGDLTGDVDYGDGFADAAAATAERTEALVLVETLKHTLDEVDSALEHLDAGTYGVCDSCGKEIGALRMEARPTSTKCVECKSLNR
ncbi:MAG: TraR/DksA family transcriptional regulator [Acidimicrobiia bacterium]|nr:TraR/DksA family transcriptional regulator [Acidimicrobiia bacterium]NNF64695.1 TraR/DksA family transcriptional regulator [Acidimicrobiia bacterium]